MMKYASVVYDKVDDEHHVLRINIDGEKRDLAFPTEEEAMEMFQRLKAYCNLSVAS